MKLLNNLFLFIVILSTVFAQSKDLALEYERATKLTNANEALQIYQRIINTNEDSDYVWLSKLKKAEMFYATGSYITSSNLLKEFNLNAPTHLQSESSKNLLFRSLDAAGESDSLKVYQKLLLTNKITKNTSKISNKRVWFIQFGAFSSLENATILKDSLNEEKINNIQIDQVFKNGKMIYYVRSNHFNSYDKALNRSKKLKKKTKFTISGF